MKNEKINKQQDPIIEMIANEAVKRYQSGEITCGGDAISFFTNLLQPTIQKLLDAELSSHLNYSKYSHVKDKTNNNARNGYCKPKQVATKYGEIIVQTPRDRNATFEPIIVEKGQTVLAGFEDKCIALYAKGMSYRDIEKTLSEIYGVKIGKEQVQSLIATISSQTEKWRNRKLKPLYAFVYADCVYVSIKDDITSQKKAVYVIIGVDAEGKKDILGIWIDKTESASFWSNVFEDLKERGVEDILFVTSDGVAGFKGSLECVFPHTKAQRCVVHLARNLYYLAPKKQAKEILGDFKKIYTSSSLDEANIYLEQFKEKYNESNKKIVAKVEDFMQYLEGLFELPAEIRKCIYTSNAIESVNSALRKVTRGKGSFPSDASLYKVLYLRIRELTDKWSKPIQSWKTIQQQLADIFGERFTKYVNV